MYRVVIFLLCLFPVLVWAEQGDLPIRTSGFFVGGGAGMSQVELKSDLGDIDGTEASYKLFAGYRWQSLFMPWKTDLGIEVAYIDLGKRYGALDSTNWELTNKGISAELIGYLPFTRHWELLGKAGAFFSDTKLNSEDMDIASGSKSSTDFALGIGVAYQSAFGWGGRFELESFSVIDGALIATLSATYQFK